MTVVALGAAAVALLSCLITLYAMRRAARLNRASWGTYEAAFLALAEAAKLVTDAEALLAELTRPTA